MPLRSLIGIGRNPSNSAETLGRQNCKVPRRILNSDRRAPYLPRGELFVVRGYPTGRAFLCLRHLRLATLSRMDSGLGRCINPQCAFGCATFFPKPDQISPNPLAQICLCDHFGMQHAQRATAGETSGAETRSVRKSESTSSNQLTLWGSIRLDSSRHLRMHLLGPASGYPQYRPSPPILLPLRPSPSLRVLPQPLRHLPYHLSVRLLRGPRNVLGRSNGMKQGSKRRSMSTER